MSKNAVNSMSFLRHGKGPISADGTPVIYHDNALRAEMALKTPEEIETILATKTARVADIVKHNLKQQAMLSRMLETADDEDAHEISEAYDAALFAEDQVLAIEESERGRLLGLPRDERYEAAIGHAEKVRLAIESARTVQREEYTRRVLGGISTRLALMAGEDVPTGAVVSALIPGIDGLPHYFEGQVERIVDLAAMREALLARRLEIFQPTYPISEVQTEAQPNFAIGITSDEESNDCTWTGFSFDADTVTLTNVEIAEEIEQLLVEGNYEQAYNSGFNILTFAMKDHIAVTILLEEAYNKHLQKYYPDLFG
jgi:hypothetical protein